MRIATSRRSSSPERCGGAGTTTSPHRVRSADPPCFASSCRAASRARRCAHCSSRCAPPITTCASNAPSAARGSRHGCATRSASPRSSRSRHSSLTDRLRADPTTYPPLIGTVGQLIGERLRSAGVRYVMGHPGGEVVDLIEGFRAAGLEFILTRHETSAAFMADAMAASSGVPGVCVATLGPGATNLVTGVAQAYLDRSPVIALTGQLPTDRYEITTHQKLDLRALFAPITKWQARVSAANVGDVTDRALRIALR